MQIGQRLTMSETGSPTRRFCCWPGLACVWTQLWYPSGAAVAWPWKCAASIFRSCDEAGLGRCADMGWAWDGTTLK